MTLAISAPSELVFMLPPRARRSIRFVGPSLVSTSSLPISRLRFFRLAHFRPPLGFFSDLPCHLAI